MKAPDYRVIMKLPPMNAAAVIIMIRNNIRAVFSAEGAAWSIGMFSEFVSDYCSVLMYAARSGITLSLFSARVMGAIAEPSVSFGSAPRTPL